METMNTFIDGLNIEEMSGERIIKGLTQTVKDQLNSGSVKIYVEHGSNKGDA